MRAEGLPTTHSMCYNYIELCVRMCSRAGPNMASHKILDTHSSMHAKYSDNV